MADITSQPIPGIINNEEDFNTYTLNWKVMITPFQEANNIDFNVELFYHQTFPLLIPPISEPILMPTLSIYFPDGSIRSLISSVGVAKIKVRFALVPVFERNPINPNNYVIVNRFTMILFGTDAQDSRCSAYYVGKPTYYTVNAGTETKDTGNISDPLAKSWVDNWVAVNTINIIDNSVTSDLFNTKYGYLNGYNYSMSDFMNALYPPNQNRESNELNVMLALHDHHSPGVIGGTTSIDTFGLVILGASQSKPTPLQTFTIGPKDMITVNSGALEVRNNSENSVTLSLQVDESNKVKNVNRTIKDAGDKDDFSFYDLSAPSPPAP